MQVLLSENEYTKLLNDLDFFRSIVAYMAVELGGEVIMPNESLKPGRYKVFYSPYYSEEEQRYSSWRIEAKDLTVKKGGE